MIKQSVRQPDEQVRRKVPFFRPAISEAEIEEVVDCLRTGWLTTGPRTKRFEGSFAEFVGAKHAVAVNSCTAALHLAVEALGLVPGQAVLVPTMTFAATAEVVRYQGAVPVLVDCDPVTLNMDLDDAERKVQDLRAGRTPLEQDLKPVGIMPVHVGGLMMDMDAVGEFAARHGLWVVEDAAHALPAAYRPQRVATGDRRQSRVGRVFEAHREVDAMEKTVGLEDSAHPTGMGPAGDGTPANPWRRCGENTAAVTCFSFYANKTITTGEGGMAVTDDEDLADRMRQMSLHGLSHDAWNRFSDSGSWDYRIVAPGYKYNLTDIASAIGIHQLERAEALRQEREMLACRFSEAFTDLEQIDLPPDPPHRIHSWHLYPIRLNLERLSLDRNEFIELLRDAGVGCSVHWRPLHLHPYYESFGWKPADLPTASAVWKRLISLPLFPGMTDDEQDLVITTVRDLCGRHGVSGAPRKPR
jgi:dTDP-4-amino-4,6-dideoxygalactose transaminase